MTHSFRLVASALFAVLPLSGLLIGCGSGSGGLINATPTPRPTVTGTPGATITPQATTTPVPTATSGNHNTFNAVFSANSSNASTAPFNPSVSNGVFSVVGNIRTLSGSYIQVVGVSPRTISITVTKPSPLAVNDSFSVNASSDQTAAVGYSEGAGSTTKAFSGVSGTVKITAISGRNVSVTLSNVVMNVADGNGLPNTATGSFTLGGNGVITAQANLS